jgi:hypothetical protein
MGSVVGDHALMSSRVRKGIRALRATRAVAAVAGLLAGCGASTPRVVLQNDTDHPLHVFYCNNLPCTEGVNGNDVILSPGKSSTDFWNSPDGDGPVGVATSPDDLLVGCFADPNPDQDAPPTATLRLSAPRPCPNQSGHPRPRLVEP